MIINGIEYSFGVVVPETLRYWYNTPYRTRQHYHRANDVSGMTCNYDRFRSLVLDTHGDVCYICGRHTPTEDRQSDHLQPCDAGYSQVVITKLGERLVRFNRDKTMWHSLHNIRIVHKSCHLEKSREEIRAAALRNCSFVV